MVHTQLDNAASNKGQISEILGQLFDLVYNIQQSRQEIGITGTLVPLDSLRLEIEKKTIKI